MPFRQSVFLHRQIYQSLKIHINNSSASLMAETHNHIICLLLLATTLASSARILDEVTSPVPLPVESPTTSDPAVPLDTDTADVAPAVAPVTTLPSGQLPATATIPTTNVAPVIPTEPPATTTIPNTSVAPVISTGPPATTTIPTTNVAPVIPTEPAAPVEAPTPDVPNNGAAPVTTPATPVTTPATTPSGGAATAAVPDDHSALSFFMHDILGGSHPSGRVVTGIIASTDANSLPFSVPNNDIFPINGGVPLNTINGVINNDNYPSLVGLNGNTLVQSNGNNVESSNNNQAFVTAGQLPQGVTLQQLMFGSVTVVDNEITEGHELGSGVLGKAQGFYITSSSDGSSHTLVLTALFHGHEHEIDDTISFFGVHRTATPISHIAIIGGTGKYENAKGYATIETLPHEDQHTTDGLETITHVAVYLTP